MKKGEVKIVEPVVVAKKEEEAVKADEPAAEEGLDWSADQ